MRAYSTPTTTELPPTPDHEDHLDRSSILPARPALIVIEPRPLIREALVWLLETQFQVVHFTGVDALAEAKNELHCDGESVILNLGRASLCRESSRDIIFGVRRILGHIPVIVITDDQSTASVSEALSLDVKAYVTTDQTPEVFIGIIRLVRAGGTFIPAGPLAQWNPIGTGRREDASSPASDSRAERLTKRQKQVLALIAEGKSNKVIAYQLSMRESTVKSHVRQIMRKFQVDNRTKAASVFLERNRSLA